jgi:hypothetical protein
MKRIMGVKRRAADLHPIKCPLPLNPNSGWYVMARWIAFDQETTSLLRSNLAQGTRIETLRRGPVDYALARPGAVVAVLPATGSGTAGIAIFRRAKTVVQARRVEIPPRVDHAVRAGGFLGLSDEVIEDDAPQEKKGWWRKFWDE